MRIHETLEQGVTEDPLQPGGPPKGGWRINSIIELTSCLCTPSNSNSTITLDMLYQISGTATDRATVEFAFALQPVSGVQGWESVC